MYRMECVKVGTLITGEIDCSDFKTKLLPNKDKPAILNVNIGILDFFLLSLILLKVYMSNIRSTIFTRKCNLLYTPHLRSFKHICNHVFEIVQFIKFAGTTVKGAVDDLDLVLQTLEECGYSHDRFYIHCDGALFGLMMPFVKKV